VEHLSSTGRATVLCIFHKEKTPSLRIWPDGGFFCHGCHQGGAIDRHPELLQLYRALRARHPAFRNPRQSCFQWAGVKVLDMEEEEAPRPTGRFTDITLTGCLVPFRGSVPAGNEQPSMLAVPGSPHSYVPVFSTLAKLALFMDRSAMPYENVKKIDDGSEFLASIPEWIPIMYDPYYTPENRVRWLEVQR